MVILYFPANFILANPIYKRFGLHAGLIVGCGLVSVCLWLRACINYNFLLAMIGGLFYGLAQPLILNANAEFAANWFDTDEVFSKDFNNIKENNSHSIICGYGIYW